MQCRGVTEARARHAPENARRVPGLDHAVSRYSSAVWRKAAGIRRPTLVAIAPRLWRTNAMDSLGRTCRA